MILVDEMDIRAVDDEAKELEALKTTACIFSLLFFLTYDLHFYILTYLHWIRGLKLNSHHCLVLDQGRGGCSMTSLSHYIYHPHPTFTEAVK